MAFRLRHVLRLLQLTSLSTVENPRAEFQRRVLGLLTPVHPDVKVRTNGVTPYAMLKVEFPALDGAALMPVHHRANFLTLHWVQLNWMWNENTELLVAYMPYEGVLAGLVARTLPPLQIALKPRGALEGLYSPSATHGSPAHSLFPRPRYWGDPDPIAQNSLLHWR